MEPIILGLALAPSPAGFSLAIASVAAFLLRHPLRLIALDYRKQLRYPRTRLAERFAIGYGAVALAFALVAIGLAERTFLSVIAAAVPLALLALVRDLTGRSREVVTELAGSVALGAAGCAIIIAGGGRVEVAWVVWLLQSLRAVTAILYVRARLRHERSESAPKLQVLATHALLLTVVTVLATSARAPLLAVAAFALLLARATVGLSRPATGMKPQIIGVQEVVFGLTTLVLILTGFRLDL